MPPTIRRLICTLLCSLILAQALAIAQTDKAIEDARLKGVAYIKSKQTEGGFWQYNEEMTESEANNVGLTALCAIALIENGVSHNDPAIRKAYDYVIEKSKKLTNTYEVALAVVMLSRTGDRRDRPKIRELAARLVAGQLKSGGWGYSCPVVDADVLQNPKGIVLKDGIGDNSCTQFAVLGLWVASRSNIDISYSLSGVSQRFVQSQKPDGGWDYNLSEKSGSGPSMTGAGLFCLSVAQADRIRKGKSGTPGFVVSQPKPETTDAATPPAKTEAPPAAEDPPVKSLLEHPVFSKGLKRTGDFVRTIGPASPKYFLWSIERIGVLLGQEKIGDTNWFEKGSDALLKTQQPDGSWTETHSNLSGTCFAVLFLRKANLGSDISRLLEGEPGEPFHILGREPAERFETLEEALAGAKAGETIRIDSNGPIPLKNLELNKDITLQAGFGYTPVCTFEVGVSRLGIRLKPEKDLPARNAINLTKGNVVLEGLHLQLDPPKTTAKFTWGGISVQGGTLRLLNCIISVSNRQPLSAVILAAPGHLVIRNSVLIGGRNGVDVVAAGKQEVTLHNSVIFCDQVIQASNSTTSKAPADLKINVMQCCAQATELFRFPSLAGNVAISTDRSAFQADWIGSNMLATTTGAAGRSYRGNKNVYDVKDWAGSRGKPNTKITDAKSWSAFWGDTDKNSFKQTATFLVLRQKGTYSHSVRVQDWQLSLPNSAEPILLNSNVGIDPYLASTGIGYDQYRDTFEYRAWMQGKLELDTEIAAAPDAGATPKAKPSPATPATPKAAKSAK